MTEVNAAVNRSVAAVCLVGVRGAADDAKQPVRARGTGFAIHDGNYVITAKHVVDACGGEKIVCVFDNAGGSSSVEIDAAPAKGAPSSPHAQSDANGKGAPPTPNELDFALLKLQRKREVVCAFAEEVNPACRKVWILQHPRGRPMAQAEGQLLDGVVTADSVVVRVRYDASTDHGSSGAPCMDEHGRVIALHHAGDPRRLLPKFNQGIPIGLIAPRLAQFFRSPGTEEDAASTGALEDAAPRPPRRKPAAPIHIERRRRLVVGAAVAGVASAVSIIGIFWAWPSPPGLTATRGARGVVSTVRPVAAPLPIYCVPELKPGSKLIYDEYDGDVDPSTGEGGDVRAWSGNVRWRCAVPRGDYTLSAEHNVLVCGRHFAGGSAYLCGCSAKDPKCTETQARSGIPVSVEMEVLANTTSSDQPGPELGRLVTAPGTTDSLADGNRHLHVKLGARMKPIHVHLEDDATLLSASMTCTVDGSERDCVIDLEKDGLQLKLERVTAE